MYIPTEIPPYPRKPAREPREAAEWMVGMIDGRIKQLADLGLCPHKTMLEYRGELVAQLKQGGPYKLRKTSAVF